MNEKCFMINQIKENERIIFRKYCSIMKLIASEAGLELVIIIIINIAYEAAVRVIQSEPSTCSLFINY